MLCPQRSGARRSVGGGHKSGHQRTEICSTTSPPVRSTRRHEPEAARPPGPRPPGRPGGQDRCADRKVQAPLNKHSRRREVTGPHAAGRASGSRARAAPHGRPDEEPPPPLPGVDRLGRRRLAEVRGEDTATGGSRPGGPQRLPDPGDDVARRPRRPALGPPAIRGRSPGQRTGWTAESPRLLLAVRAVDRRGRRPRKGSREPGAGR
jgi:hypothetical protein